MRGLQKEIAKNRLVIVALCVQQLSLLKGTKSKSAKAGLENMKILLNYCALYNCSDVVSFDLSLARGLVSLFRLL